MADELVDWFNTCGYHLPIRVPELFDRHFTRFDAKLEQRIAELKSEFHADTGSLESGLIRWMVGLWVGYTLTLIAAIVAVVRL